MLVFGMNSYTLRHVSIGSKFRSFLSIGCIGV